MHTHVGIFKLGAIIDTGNLSFTLGYVMVLRDGAGKEECLWDHRWVHHGWDREMNHMIRVRRETGQCSVMAIDGRIVR